MLQPIKNWFLRNSVLIAFSLSVFVAVGSLIGTNSLPKQNFSISDKALHALAYFLLMWSWLIVFRKDRSFKSKLSIFMCLLVFGIILEFLQGEMLLHRTADWKDVMANVIGLVLGLITFKRMYQITFKKGETIK